jgi:hypothetical protein
VARYVELRRHTDSDGDMLTEEGVHAALEIGRGLTGPYALLVSSGAQRATQTLACFACALTDPVNGGAIVEAGLRSDVEDRWRAAYRTAGSGELSALRTADPELARGLRAPGRRASADSRSPARGRARARGRPQPHQRGGGARSHRQAGGADRKGRRRAHRGRGTPGLGRAARRNVICGAIPASRHARNKLNVLLRQVHRTVAERPGSRPAGRRPMVVNMPSEPVFTTPDRRRTEGVVRPRQPMHLVGGGRIEGP